MSEREPNPDIWLWDVCLSMIIAGVVGVVIAIVIFNAVTIRKVPDILLSSTPREYQVTAVHEGKSPTVDLAEVGSPYRFNGLSVPYDCRKVAPIGSVRVLVEEVYQGRNSPYSAIVGLRALCDR